MKDFDTLVRCSKPKVVRDLSGIENEAERLSEAKRYADLGFAIDLPIDVWGWDAQVVMRSRRDQGFTWTPAANQPPIPVMPGLGFPGLPPYDPNSPPEGSIKTSLNPADYPIAEDLIVRVKPFGQWPFKRGDASGMGTEYIPLPEDTSDVGAEYHDDAAKEQYEKKLLRVAFGEYVLWERVPYTPLPVKS